MTRQRNRLRGLHKYGELHVLSQHVTVLTFIQIMTAPAPWHAENAS